MTNGELPFDAPPPEKPKKKRRRSSTPHFDGSTYDPAFDYARLESQLWRVFGLMWDGEWRTLEQIAQATGGSEAGVSARLRDFRKPKFGGHTVNARRVGEPKSGLFEYQVIFNKREHDEPAKVGS